LQHKPVLLKEVLENFNLRAGATVLDGTLGNGGHSEAILEVIGPQGRLIGLDQDPASIDRCREKFKTHPNVTLHHSNFVHLASVLDSLNVPFVDAVILDVGLSSNQLGDPQRGFSFDEEGPLDMRMNPDVQHSASDLVNDLSQENLAEIFWEYANEKNSRRFARAIDEARRKQRIETTQDLVSVLQSALPKHMQFKKGARPHWARRHPATRVFQALRMAVNDELGALRDGIPAGWERLRPKGCMAVISFHSLEDRIVKNHFRSWKEALKAEGIHVTYEDIYCREGQPGRTSVYEIFQSRRLSLVEEP